MAVAAGRVRLGSRGAPDASKAAILKAAIKEFARGGVAGARIDAIARAAKVNKALLYYYYVDKERLYGAALEEVFRRRYEILAPILAADIPPGEKVLRYAGAMFDYFAENPSHREMVQREVMVSSRHGQILRVFRQQVQPMFEEIVKTVRAGIESGEFRDVDPLQFTLSMGAVIVQYFSSAPLMKLFLHQDPLTPERLAARKAAVLDFISAALFRHNDSPRRGGAHEPA